ncbi:hypothetical protein V8F06_005747 [Rhypophila decipiens]
MLTMDDLSSPDSAGARMTFFTSPESLTSTVDDNFDVYIKEDSESPPAEDGKHVIHRRRPQQSKPAANRTASGRTLKSTKLTSKSGASVSRPGQGHSSHLPIIPRKAEDWDPWKSILHELYITQNRILRDIINIMDTTYNLKATPKMYKNQFARWGFFKYAVKHRPRIKSDARALKENSDDDPQDMMLDDDEALDSFDTAVMPLIHQNDSTRTMQSGMTAVQHFLHGYIDLDATHVREDAIFSLHEPMYRYFKAAMDLFDLNENVQGGRVLRLAFLQIEPMINNPNIKSFADLCLLVPHLLLESDRRDILAAYLTYLTRLATVKFGHHPMADIVASFAELMNRPEDIMRYIMILSQINAETLSGVDNMNNHTQEWAKNVFLGCQRTIQANPNTIQTTKQIEPGSPSSPNGNGATTLRFNNSALMKMGKLKHDHHMIRLEAQGVYWAQKLVLQDPEADDLATQWLHGNYEPDFAERAEAYQEKIQARIDAGLVPPGMERLMESLCLGWLNDYYETTENWPKVFEWGRRGLQFADNEQFAIWSMNLENLMRKFGNQEEADELRRQRLEHQWVEKVRREVEELSLD